MTLALASYRTALTPPWVRNDLWRRAQAVPSLDLRFADNKSLTDAVTGASLVTFTRASAGMFVGSDGLIKTAVTNLLLRSEEFDNASWTKQSSVSVSANTTISPDGALTADTVTADQSFNIFQNVAATVSTTYTNSVYIKAGTATSMMLRDDTGAGRHIVFNPSTGVITATSGTLVSSGSQALNNGWYRYFMTYVADTTTVRGMLRPNSAGSAQTYIAWGAQIEAASTVGEYIPTTSTVNSAPRFTHDPTTGESLGLLVEEERTNLLLNSGTLSTQSATVTAVAHTLSFTGTGTITLTGTSTAGPLVGTGTGEANRVSLTFTPTAGSLTLTVSGTVTNAQLEAGASRTSYIATAGATATRAADVASITGANFSSWYNHNEGTLHATASIRGGNTVVSSGLAIINGIAKLAESAVTVNARALTFNTSTSPNRYAYSQRSSLSNTSIFDNYEAIQFGKHYTLGGSYVNNSTQGIALSVDGRTVITNLTAVDVPVPTRLLIGAGNTGSNAGVGIDEYYLNGTIKRLTYWPTRLSNSTLQAISQP